VTRGVRLLTVSVPALALALLVAAGAVEVWVRATWDVRKGKPGFFLTDAARGQRLAAGYDGWFAGVPVHINSLELRDPREYALAKGPNTFRILVLGDSVTFGHGSVYEHTYPYLLEQRLKAWRPNVDWQVWNAGVPGYNTSQELAHLLEVGDRFRPDLVIVGFFDNDLADNYPVQPPGALKVAAARVLSVARRHVYSLELYKRLYLTIASRLSGSEGYRRRLEHLGTEEALLADVDASALPEQQLTAYERLPDEEVRRFHCVQGMTPNPDTVPAIERAPGFGAWVDAVRGFQRLAREGRYRVVFFANDAPPACHDTLTMDLFYDGGTSAVDALYMRILGDETPAVSSYDAFMHMRPSQMPNAAGHSLGNANAVKADVLFTYLRDRLMPTLLRGHGAALASAPPR
jgi:hypothetical protein